MLPKIDGEKVPDTKTRIAYRCAADTGVTWRLAYDVLFKNAPITNIRREMVYRWALDKRLLGPRDVVIKPPRKRSKASPVKKLIKDAEALLAGAETAGSRDVHEATIRKELEERAARVAAGQTGHDYIMRLVAEAEEREKAGKS